MKLSAAILATAPLAAAQDPVLVVDGALGPGADFAGIQEAVDAAQDGAVVLVRAGFYASFDVDGTGLVVAADLGADVVIDSGLLEITGVPAGSEVALQGLRIRAGQAGSVRLADCAGAVWFQDCALEPTPPPIFIGLNALEANDCSAVTVVACSLESAPQVTPAFDTPPGLQASGTNLFLYDSTFVGGAGVNAGADLFGATAPGEEGGPGARLSGGFAFASGCAFTGGKGGDAFDFGTPMQCEPAGDGGAGLRLAGGAPEVHLLDGTTTGGAGGAPGGPCPMGAAGPGVVQLTGTLTPIAGSARHLSATPVLREGELLTLDFEGGPGEPVIVGFGLEQGPLFLAPFAGAVLPGGALSFLTVGTTAGDGKLSFSLTIADAFAAGQGGVVYLQSVFVTPLAELRLSNGRMVLLLDRTVSG